MLERHACVHPQEGEDLRGVPGEPGFRFKEVFVQAPAVHESAEGMAEADHGCAFRVGMALRLDEADTGVKLNSEVEVLVAEERPVVLGSAERSGVMCANEADVRVLAIIELGDRVVSCRVFWIGRYGKVAIPETVWNMLL